MRITGTVIGDAEVVARFDRIGERLREELRNGIERAGFTVQRHSKQSKLSGQVLRVQTGRLRRSINVRMRELPGVVEATVGTNVAYARAHEFGFRGAVSVREHLRTAKSGQSSTVRAHTRQVNLPERSFLRSALADMRAAVRAEIEAATSQALAVR